MIFFLTSCSVKNEKLILATEAGFAPYEYYENGEIVGVDIDIAREIAKELNMELEIKDVAFDSIINEVKSGKSDIGAAGISYPVTDTAYKTKGVRGSDTSITLNGKEIIKLAGGSPGQDGFNADYSFLDFTGLQDRISDNDEAFEYLDSHRYYGSQRGLLGMYGIGGGFSGSLATGGAAFIEFYA